MIRSKHSPEEAMSDFQRVSPELIFLVSGKNGSNPCRSVNPEMLISYKSWPEPHPTSAIRWWKEGLSFNSQSPNGGEKKGHPEFKNAFMRSFLKALRKNVEYCKEEKE